MNEWMKKNSSFYIHKAKVRIFLVSHIQWWKMTKQNNDEKKRKQPHPHTHTHAEKIPDISGFFLFEDEKKINFFF